MLRAVQGATNAPLALTWKPAANLTGATLSGKITQDRRTFRGITGALTVTSGAAGTFAWDCSDADLAVPGVWEVQFTAVISGEAVLTYSDLLTIEAAFGVVTTPPAPTPTELATHNADAAAHPALDARLDALEAAAGVSDHGALTGLGDDDHPQYLNQARGDARYWPLSTDLATQAELDGETTSRAAADTALDGRLDTLESAAGLATVAIALLVSQYTSGTTPGADATPIGDGSASATANLTGMTECRLLFGSSWHPAADQPVLAVQYRAEGDAAWSYLDGAAGPAAPLAGGNYNQMQDSGWQSIALAARTLVQLRLVSRGGNGVSGYNFTGPTLQVRGPAFGVVVTDHGDLSGLGDDDHPQYHTDARGDARYHPSVVILAGLASARPTAGTVGRLYYSTDTGDFARDTGTTWQTISTAIGSLPAASSGADADEIAASQSGTARKLTLAQVLAYVQSADTGPIRSDVARYVRLYEDFLSASLGSFVNGSSGTGAGPVYTVAAEAGRPGIVQLQTGTDTSGFATIGVQGTPGTLQVLFGGGAWTHESVVRLPTLSDASNTFNVRIGFNDVRGGDPVDGACFKYSHGVNAGKWQLLTASNGSTSTADSGVPVVANQWYKLRIEVNAAGTSAAFYIDGTLVGTIATNIPAGTGRETGVCAAIAKTAGTTSRSLDIDYLFYRCDLTASR